MLCAPYNVIFTPVNMIKLLALCTVQRYLMPGRRRKGTSGRGERQGLYSTDLARGTIVRAGARGFNRSSSKARSCSMMHAAHTPPSRPISLDKVIAQSYPDNCSIPVGTQLAVRWTLLEARKMTACSKLFKTGELFSYFSDLSWLLVALALTIIRLCLGHQ